ncbi:MAG: hypothetical protein FWG84_09645 [Bacteroidales bacterium]|nr:hypothetical protein [Bacteroidales bacterium]
MLTPHTAIPSEWFPKGWTSLVLHPHKGRKQFHPFEIPFEITCSRFPVLGPISYKIVAAPLQILIKCLVANFRG